MEATIQGCRIFYRYTKAEKANGSTILLLHGWGCDSSIFSFIEKGLSEQADVLTVDFPGHGQSGEPPVPWGFPNTPGRLPGCLNRFPLQKCAWWRIPSAAASPSILPRIARKWWSKWSLPEPPAYVNR